jgi:hypothetical protein
MYVSPHIVSRNQQTFVIDRTKTPDLVRSHPFPLAKSYSRRRITSDLLALFAAVPFSLPQVNSFTLSPSRYPLPASPTSARDRSWLLRSKGGSHSTAIGDSNPTLGALGWNLVDKDPTLGVLGDISLTFGRFTSGFGYLRERFGSDLFACVFQVPSFHSSRLVRVSSAAIHLAGARS